MKQTFCLTFQCRKQKANRQGLAPIEAVLIINGERTIITTTRKERPSDFEKMGQDILDYTEQVRMKVNSIQTELMRNGISITPITIKEYYKTGGRKTYTLDMMFDEYVDIVRKRYEGGDIGKRSYQRYVQIKGVFLTLSGLKGNMKVEEVTTYHIELFKAELIKKGYEQSTVGAMMKKVKSIMDMAFKTGKIKSCPFYGVNIPREVKDVQFLDISEVNAIRNLDLSHCERLERVRNLFLFQTFTGLSYCDMAGLVREDFQINELGQIYIRKKRGKTGVWYTTVLMGDAVRLIKEYGYKLPLLTNQKYNSYLKEIADLAGITKPLHTHIARHTMATMMLSVYKVPIEVVSKMLGHTNIEQTKHYAKLVDDSVFKIIKDIA